MRFDKDDVISVAIVIAIFCIFCILLVVGYATTKYSYSIGYSDADMISPGYEILDTNFLINGKYDETGWIHVNEKPVVTAEIIYIDYRYGTDDPEYEQIECNYEIEMDCDRYEYHGKTSSGEIEYEVGFSVEREKKTSGWTELAYIFLIVVVLVILT